MKNKNIGPQNISDIFKNKSNAKKPPAYKWQDLALRVIDELNIPGFKRSSVFKVCRDKNEQIVLKALNDTKELCKSGIQWKYFFKVVDKGFEEIGDKKMRV